jgi:D,D-heptose 1,7-bisphosphate phosphatase
MVDTAYILCGGKGTRMGEISTQVPKPMLPILGKPVLEHIILQCKINGIYNICLITGHLSQIIEEYFKNGRKWGVEISYFIEKEPLGTTGAFKEMESVLPSVFWILYGDVIFDMDLSKMYGFHIRKKAALTLAAHPNDHPFDSDLVKVDETDRVIEILPKPHSSDILARNLVNAALYLVNKEVITYLPDGRSDWGRRELPRICKSLPVYAWRTTEYIKDMGTPERIQKVTEDVLRGKPAIRNLKNLQKAIFLDRDGVLNEDKDLIKSPDELVVFPFAGESIRQINKSEYLAIVVTNQSVVARGLTDSAGLDKIHAKLDKVLAESEAYLDDLYYCPHHPDSGYEGEIKELKIKCTCRKPSPGMLLAAAEKYNIDLSQSWIIGDRNSDIEAGKAAGCITVGVLTGNGLKNLKTMPYFIFGNLPEAIEYILTKPHHNVLQKLKSLLKNHLKGRPAVIAIAGNTGSGKSTLSNYLQIFFNKEGFKTLKIELDQWILPQSQRGKVHNLYEVYRIDKIQENLRDLIKGKKVMPPGYQRHPTWSIEPPVYLLEPDTDLVILDGIIAFEASKSFKNQRVVKIYCKTSPEKFTYNLIRLNTWKGRTKDEIKSMFDSRKKTEYEKIEILEREADILVEY